MKDNIFNSLQQSAEDAEQKQNKARAAEPLAEHLEFVRDTYNNFAAKAERTPEQMAESLADVLERALGLQKTVASGVEFEQKPPVLCISGQRICTAGSVSVVLGAPKSRKTSLLHLFGNAILTGTNGCIHSALPEGAKLLWVDTEQDQFFTANGYRIITEGMSNKDLNRLQYLELKPYSRRERLLYTFAAVEMFKPDFVIIDGITDLVDGVNDEVQAGVLFDMLNYFAERDNLCIMGAIHTNGEGQTDARGHVGREIQRKCETAILCVNETEGADSYTVIKPKYCRNREFEVFNVKHDENGKPYSCNIISDNVQKAWGEIRPELEAKDAPYTTETLKKLLVGSDLGITQKRDKTRKSSFAYYIDQFCQRGWLVRSEHRVNESICYQFPEYAED